MNKIYLCGFSMFSMCLCGKKNNIWVIFNTQLKRMIENELGTATNIIKIIKTLEIKEIIERVGKHIEFLDPAFRLWFKGLHKIP